MLHRAVSKGLTFCLSVSPSVCHRLVSHAYAYDSRYRKFQQYDKAMIFYSFLKPNFIVVGLGVHPEKVCYREVPPVESENLTNNPQ